MKKIDSSTTRTYLAVCLFAISISVAFAAPQLSKSRSKVWVAARNIPGGVQLTQSDLARASVTLDSKINGYLSSEINPIGSITKRSIFSGEIISSHSISDDSTYLNAVEVGISIRSSDLPLHTKVGDLVSVFQIHDVRNGESESAPLLVIESAFVAQLSHQGANLGSDYSVTLSINRSDLALLLQATSSGRLTLVGRHG